MALTRVFRGRTDPTQPNLSARFTDATAFYIAAPFVDIEVEIDVFLQVYLPLGAVRNIPLGKISEQAVLLNLTDTESVSLIPQEFLDANLEMALLFLPSQEFILEAFVISKDVNLTDIQTQLTEISQQIGELETINNQNQDLLLDSVLETTTEIILLL